jgi:hypothetical protein
MMESTIKLFGIFGLAAFILYSGYLFWDKDKFIAFLLILIGIGLAIYVICSEIGFKRRRHEAPWLFDQYKGE